MDTNLKDECLVDVSYPTFVIRRVFASAVVSPACFSLIVTIRFCFPKDQSGSLCNTFPFCSK